jgi:hypothetical protein
VKLHVLESRPDLRLTAALEQFESQFRYPLGSDSWFRISHGDDYTCFFRAIGQAECLVATRDSKVVGVISSTICDFRGPGNHDGRAVYISDLKVSEPAAGRTLLRLIHGVRDRDLLHPLSAYSVVMDGTGQTPTAYTGRLGIPAFHELAKIMILRIPCDAVDHTEVNHVRDHAIPDVKLCYRRLTADHFATSGGHSLIRSLMKPVGLIHADGNSCGILEDTRRGKLLFRADGTEMLSGHLSCFGYGSVLHAAGFLRGAMLTCRRLNIPALFVSVPADDVEGILQHLPTESIVRAPATVFGYALRAEQKWSINTAEI